MGLALEEPKKNDEIFPEGEFDVIIDKDVLKRVGNVHVHLRPNVYVGAEFVVTPENRG
jgi:Fe-S cluster assembly iron-binding protein IscA